MDWNAKIFSYCERGLDPGFWAEPWNALSNGAFVLAAALAAILLAVPSRSQRSSLRPRTAEWLLVGLVAVIGIGSFLFHTFATQWSSTADVAPIGLFMFAYLTYALRRFIGLHWLLVAICLVGFAALLQAAFTVTCPPAVRDLVRGARCLNGSIGYAPALGMLVAVGCVARLRGHPASTALLAASLIFAISMVARTLDVQLCASLRFAGRAIGTHFMWHMLNALTLFILLVAAIRHGQDQPERPAAE